jgi:hypothetical protein
MVRYVMANQKTMGERNLVYANSMATIAVRTSFNASESFWAGVTFPLRHWSSTRALGHEHIALLALVHCLLNLTSDF